MMTGIPYILTLCLGTLGLKALLQNDKTLCTELFLSLAALLGMAESIFICFLSFVFLNRFHLPFILTVHLAEIVVLFFITKNSLNVNGLKSIFRIQHLDFAAVLVFAGITAALYTNIYPNGGWDAWQVWNFKSKFLLLSGTRWKEIFDPVLWRSSPHYPLALPLLNAWSGAFAENSLAVITRINAVIFNVITAGLMFGLLRQHSRSRLIILPVLFCFLIPIHMFITTNQYADIFLGIFFLGSLASFYQFVILRKKEFLLSAGIFLGILSFTKPEGSVLAVITFLCGHFYYLKDKGLRRDFPLLWISTLIALIPMIVFLLFLSPGNQTFINGLASQAHPSTLLRLKMIFSFLADETILAGWRQAWPLIFFAGILNLNRIFRQKFFIFYTAIILYLGVVCSYYWINTRFEIMWWLTVSLKRILSTLLPAAAVWVSLGIFSKKKAPAAGLELDQKNIP